MSRGGAATSSTEVTSKSSSNKWFGLAALAVVGLVGWSLTSGSGGGSASNDEAGIAGAESAEPVAVPVQDSSSTTAEEVDEADEDEEMEAETSPDIAELDGPDQAAGDLVLLAENGEPAALDEPLALSVLLVSSGSLKIIELDTARMVEMTTVRGDFVMMTETHLLQMTNSGALHAWALDDIEAEPVLLNTGHPEVSVGPRPDQVWLLTRSGDNSVSPRILVDLDTGETIRSYALDAAVTPIQGGPGDLVNAWGGGVFEESGGGQFRRFADGWAIAANDELVLVRHCGHDLDCSARWLDRETGSTRGLPSPDVSNFIWWGSSIDPTSTWLWDRAPDSVGLIEIATGEAIELPGIEAWPGPSFSADGRWVTYLDHAHGQIQVVGLETGTIYHLERRFNGGYAALVETDSLSSTANNG